MTRLQGGEVGRTPASPVFMHFKTEPNRHALLTAGQTLRHRLTASVFLGIALTLTGAPAAGARPYTVVSCDAALAGFSAEAWRPSGTVGSAYSTCPSSGGLNAGISNRITGVTVPALSNSSHTFTAPAGTTISSLRWGGRLARGSCSWGAMMLAQPASRFVFGLRPNLACADTALDIRGSTIPLPLPAGVTSVQQLLVCAASSCGPGAAFHTQSVAVTVEDPTRPTITASGPLVSGRWVRGDPGARDRGQRQQRDRVGHGRAGLATAADGVRLQLLAATAVPLSVRARRSFPTAQVQSGSHRSPFRAVGRRRQHHGCRRIR